ncbi:MAG: hypothetical protein QOH47_3126 [Sphingomonadales bacterium]|nr:hypothetical protein [Sphingomonadales bacterium]
MGTVPNWGQPPGLGFVAGESGRVSSASLEQRKSNIERPEIGLAAGKGWLNNWAYPAHRRRCALAKLVVMKKGGGGKVAINPEQVTHIKSATGAFTDVFLSGQQVAVEATFEEVVALLSEPHRRAEEKQPPAPGAEQRGLVFNPPGR